MSCKTKQIEASYNRTMSTVIFKSESQIIVSQLRKKCANTDQKKLRIRTLFNTVSAKGNAVEILKTFQFLRRYVL